MVECSSSLEYYSLQWYDTTNIQQLLSLFLSAAGSTHNITMTDDLDEGFKDLALNRHGGVRPMITSLDQQPESFNYEDIKKHADKLEPEGSKPDEDEPLIEF